MVWHARETKTQRFHTHVVSTSKNQLKTQPIYEFSYHLIKWKQKENGVIQVKFIEKNWEGKKDFK